MSGPEHCGRLMRALFDAKGKRIWACSKCDVTFPRRQRGNRVPSEATRRKISEATKRALANPEVRAKMHGRRGRRP